MKLKQIVEQRDFWYMFGIWDDRGKTLTYWRVGQKTFPEVRGGEMEDGKKDVFGGKRRRKREINVGESRRWCLKSCR